MNIRKGFARLARVTALTYWVVAIISIGGPLLADLQDESAGRRQYRVDLTLTGSVLRACGPRWEAGGAPVPCDRRIERHGMTFIFPHDATDAEIDRAIRFEVTQERTRREQQQAREQRVLSRQQELNAIREDARARLAAREQAGQDAAAANERLFVPGYYDERGNSTGEFVQAPGENIATRRAATNVPHVYVWASDAYAALDVARRHCRRSNAVCRELPEHTVIGLSLRDRMNYALNRNWQPAFIWLIVYVGLWAVFRAARYVALGFMEKPESSPPQP